MKLGIVRSWNNEDGRPQNIGYICSVLCCQQVGIWIGNIILCERMPYKVFNPGWLQSKSTDHERRQMSKWMIPVFGIIVKFHHSGCIKSIVYSEEHSDVWICDTMDYVSMLCLGS